MISVIQILSVIFGLFMLYMIRIHSKKLYLTIYETYFWIFLWISFIYVAIFPQTFKGVIQKLQIARVFDLLVIIAFMIVTFVSIQNRVDNKKLKSILENFVRRKTLHDAKKKAAKN